MKDTSPEMMLYIYKQEELIRWAEHERLAQRCQNHIQDSLGHRVSTLLNDSLSIVLNRRHR